RMDRRPGGDEDGLPRADAERGQLLREEFPDTPVPARDLVARSDAHGLHPQQVTQPRGELVEIDRGDVEHLEADHPDPPRLGQQFAHRGAGDAHPVGHLGLSEAVEVVRGGGAVQQVQVHRGLEHGAPPRRRGRAAVPLRHTVAAGTIVPHFCARCKVGHGERARLPTVAGWVGTLRPGEDGTTTTEEGEAMTAAASAVLGVDVGTASSKGVLVALDGTILRSTVREHTVQRPAPGHVEIDAEIWWSEFLSIAQELTAPGDVVVTAVGVSGMGPCALLTDERGTPVRPAILYGVDTRAEAQIRRLTNELGKEEV